MNEAKRRLVALVVSLAGIGGITLLSSAILVVLWMGLIWVGQFASMVLPAWLVTTARYAVWAFALMSVAAGAAFILLLYLDAALPWAYAAVGIQKAETPTDSTTG